MKAKRVKTPTLPSYRRVIYALLISNGVTLLLFLVRALSAQSDRYWFLIWNLFLAWLPLLFAWWLCQRLRTSTWQTWQNVGLSLLWLSFLPNSFYLLSDLIHLHETGEVSLLYDVVLFCLFIFNAYVVGFMSLFMIHRELLKRFMRRKAHAIIAGVLLACGFAIYLGRSLRWNSWDVVINPAGILFDVSDRVFNPGADPQVFVTTTTFFLLLSSMYLVIWELVRALIADTRD